MQYLVRFVRKLLLNRILLIFYSNNFPIETLRK